MKVERYEIIGNHGRLLRNSDGGWVEFSAYEQLEKERDRETERLLEISRQKSAAEEKLEKVVQLLGAAEVRGDKELQAKLEAEQMAREAEAKLAEQES